VIKWEIRVLLRHLLDQGLSKAAIARQVGVNRRTINRWLAEGQLDRDVETGQVPRPVRQSRPTKLEPYKPIIQARLERYPELTAVRLLEELKAAGYTRGISQVKDYVSQVRPQPAPEPLVRFETEPGHQAQVDSRPTAHGSHSTLTGTLCRTVQVCAIWRRWTGAGRLNGREKEPAETHMNTGFPPIFTNRTFGMLRWALRDSNPRPPACKP
jgi:transposase